MSSKLINGCYTFFFDNVYCVTLELFHKETTWKYLKNNFATQSARKRCMLDMVAITLYFLQPIQYQSPKNMGGMGNTSAAMVQYVTLDME